MDAERIAREEQVDDAAADYLLLADERATLLQSVHAVEERMLAPVTRLVELGESRRRILALLNLEADDARRVSGHIRSLKTNAELAATRSGGAVETGQQG
ncbi:hypothetical protein [Ruania zhangjianzhongii]|uniref:hypothetical protein n=1 Tax=Ruania zhangjianzhongii TaxID=2603206 RepID=UPI0011CC85D7|nr:hypothetical protein [Ruania zhangjianzhongii]